MITHAEIKCFNCDNAFPVYWHKWEKGTSLDCPFCVTQLNERSEQMIRHALGVVADLNRELRSDHMDGTQDLFQVDFKHVYVPLEKYRLDE